MKNVKYTLLAAVVGGAFALSSTANAAFLSYYFDPDGAGPQDSVLVNEFLNYTGNVYVENEYQNGNDFTLQQSGYSQISGKDGNISSALVGADIFARYSGGGFGNFDSGSVSFTDGSLELFSGGFDGTRIAAFDIIGGGSQQLELTGAPDGASGLDARATFFEEGYFFKNNNGSIGQDFATLNLNENIIFGFATNDLSLITSQGTIDGAQSVLDMAFPGNTFSGVTVADESGRLTNLYAGADGQFRLSTVPEPGMLGMAGVGLLALGFAMRRRRDSQL